MNAEKNDLENRTEGLVSRRYFLEVIGGGAVGIAAAGSLVLSGEYLSPNVVKEPSTRFKAGSPENYPPGSVTLDTNKRYSSYARKKDTFTRSLPSARTSVVLQTGRRRKGLSRVRAMGASLTVKELKLRVRPRGHFPDIQ